jgi:alkylation response protein AidB-like acyl-CoA dehydrogenase
MRFMTKAGALEAARKLAPLVADCADEAERDRELPGRLVAAMADAGLFKIWVPAKFGGSERDFATFVDIVTEVGRIDGSAGWITFVHAVYGALAAYLPDSAANEIYSGSDAILAGTLNPTGRAIPTKDGYLVTGRWAFGSGISHSTWVLGNCVVADSGNAGGPPQLIITIFARTDCEIHDTWYVSGLKGTGSHDYSVNNLFVPTERTFPAFSAVPRQPGKLYAGPFITLFAATVATPALGIARGAIDSAIELAGRKTPTGSTSTLRERPSAQAALGRAEGLFQAGRAGLIDAVERMLDKVEAGTLSMHDRAIVRIAAAQAAANAAYAVQLAFNVAGSTANELASPLQRQSRDIHAATQHIGVVENNFEIAGRVLVGLEPGTPRF